MWAQTRSTPGVCSAHMQRSRRGAAKEYDSAIFKCSASSSGQCVDVKVNGCGTVQALATEAVCVQDFDERGHRTKMQCGRSNARGSAWEKRWWLCSFLHAALVVVVCIKLAGAAKVNYCCMQISWTSDWCLDSDCLGLGCVKGER